MPRIAFANSLRGIAAVTVLLGHYVLVFNNVLKGAFRPFPPAAHDPFPWVVSVFSVFPMNLLNPGPVAVALFFLVSGFVIPNSVASLSTSPKGRLAFAVGRAFRLVPTYAVGLAVTLAALTIAYKINGREFTPSPQAIAANVTLFRDWMGHVTFDGVIWTLEVEAKFYLLVLLFFSPIASGRLYPIWLVAMAAVTAAPLGSQLQNTINSVGWANVLWTLPYLQFMCIGVVLNYHYRRLVSASVAAMSVAVLYATFVLVSILHGMHWTTPSSYGFSLCVFVALYVFGRNWSGGPLIRFFAAISFPLYACHPMLGYVGLSWLIANGVHPLVALALQVTVTVLVATAIHVVIEKPTHRLGRVLTRRIANRDRVDPSALVAARPIGALAD